MRRAELTARKERRRSLAILPVDNSGRRRGGSDTKDAPWFAFPGAAASCATSPWDVTQALSQPIAAKPLYLLMFIRNLSFGSASYPRNQNIIAKSNTYLDSAFPFLPLEKVIKRYKLFRRAFCLTVSGFDAKQ
jgi:hypothetical protein